MKVAITGASGYVGGAIVREFESNGHETLKLSRRECPGEWSSYSLGDDPSKINWKDVDALVHAAYDFSPHTFHEIQNRNVIPSAELFTAARNAGVQKIILISTISAFDGCRSMYGKAKLEIEKEALAAGATVIRPGLVWGKQPGGMMGSLEKIVSALPIVPYLCGAGGLRQFLVHEQDLAASVVKWTCREPASQTLTIAHPTPLTLRQILVRIAAKKNLRRVFIPVPWPFAMVALKAAEACGISLPFRSDSLTSLIHGNSAVVFYDDASCQPRPMTA